MHSLHELFRQFFFNEKSLNTFKNPVHIFRFRFVDMLCWMIWTSFFVLCSNVSHSFKHMPRLMRACVYALRAIKFGAILLSIFSKSFECTKWISRWWYNDNDNNLQIMSAWKSYLSIMHFVTHSMCAYFIIISITWMNAQHLYYM